MDNKDRFLERLLASSSTGSLPIIGEIKAYTPNNGDLLRGRSIQSIVDAYEMMGMACISVVTGSWFKGHIDMLKQASNVTNLPILRKDFIVSKSAVQRSKDMGASAILLTKQLVSDALLKKLSNHALTLGITPFIEIGSLNELDGMRVDSDAVVAICNRDIKVKETDNGGIDKSLALLEAAKTTGAGAIVSASAIESAGDAATLLEVGFDGLLIGTAFLLAPNMREILDEFGKRLSYSRIENEKLKYKSAIARGDASQNLRHDIRV